MKGNNRYISTRKSSRGGKSVASYQVRIHYYDEHGTRRHYTKTFPVKDQRLREAALYSAREHRDQMLRAFSEIGFDLKNINKTTVQDLFDKIPNYRARSQKTYKNYRDRYGVYIKPDYGNKPIQAITVEDITKSLAICADRCVQSSVVQVFSIWKAIYKVAMIEQIPVRDIPAMVDIPQSRKVNPRALKEWNITEEDFQDFCRFFSFYGGYETWEKEKIYKRDIILYMIKLMRITALRPQEVKALSKSDFVFDEVTFTEKESGKVITVPCVRINIVKSVGSTRTELLTVKDVKTPQSKRVVPVLKPEDIALIREILAFTRNDLVFTDYYGGLFSSDDVSDLIHRVRRSYARNTGKDLDFYAYLMRKSMVSDNRRDKVNPSATKLLLGHQSENVAGRWYASADDEEVLNLVYSRAYKHKKGYE